MGRMGNGCPKGSVVWNSNGEGIAARRQLSAGVCPRSGMDGVESGLNQGRIRVESQPNYSRITAELQPENLRMLRQSQRRVVQSRKHHSDTPRRNHRRRKRRRQRLATPLQQLPEGLPVPFRKAENQHPPIKLRPRQSIGTVPAFHAQQLPRGRQRNQRPIHNPLRLPQLMARDPSGQCRAETHRQKCVSEVGARRAPPPPGRAAECIRPSGREP